MFLALVHTCRFFWPLADSKEIFFVNLIADSYSAYTT